MRVSPQLLVFSYHKTGTSLFLHVMTKVTERLGLTLANHYGQVERIDPEPDVVLLPHSTLRTPPDPPYRAIRLIRDPRDIWVSAYLYHRRSVEEWCINTNLDPTPPIQWPKVDHSIAHWPEDGKLRYLRRLGGKSYQQNLLDRGVADGLDFELEGYTGCTLAAMRAWRLNATDALDVKLEDAMADFDGTLSHIFEYFGFTREQSQTALDVARSEDIRRMDDAAIAHRPQIHSRTISKWCDLLSAEQIARFDVQYGDLIRELGYQPASASPNTQPPAGLPTTRDAGIRLSTDATSIRPADARHGDYIFVVPSGSQLVRLESHRGSPPAPHAPKSHDDARPLGVRVSQILIRSDAGEVVIAADDPRLTAGWHAAECHGNDLWRWTDGAALLPWDGIRGPAIVTIRCKTLAEYPVHAQNHEP